jgi:hypothetical protein
MKMHRCAKKHSRMALFNTAGGVSVLSESEVLVMFVTLNSEGSARNISERYKIVKYLRVLIRKRKK